MIAKFQDIPIVKHTNRETGEVVDNSVFCADILDVLTQNFFAQKGKHVDEKPHVEDVKVCCCFCCYCFCFCCCCCGFVNTWMRNHMWKMSRFVAMILLLLLLFLLLLMLLWICEQVDEKRPGVDFSYNYRWENIIEIALSDCAVRRCPAITLQICAKTFGEQRITIL